MNPRPKAYIVGVGPGAPDHLTPRARWAIAESQIILGWDLDLEPARELLLGKSVYLQNVENFMALARKSVEEAKKTRKTLGVLRIGDPCVSSGLLELLQLMPEFQVEVVPGISSVQLAASIAGINLDDSVVVSFHDYGNPELEKEFMLSSFKAPRHIIMLASPDLRPDKAAGFLIGNGVDEKTLGYVCSRLSLPGQSILRARLKRIRTVESFDWLSILVVINPNVPSPSEARRAWEEWRAKELGSGR
jgi:cobalt-precorrin-7 (C5)-methyltransferase